MNDIFNEDEAPSSPMDDCEMAESTGLLVEETTGESSETLGEFTSLLLLP